jgi:serine/threonine-protein kinase
MATVYRAKDRQTGRLVALKVMDPGLARDLDLLKKFLREGEVLRTLNTKHPEAPIVRVVDFGRESGRTNGRPFIAMELLQGRDALSYLQGRGRLSAEEAKGIVRQVLTALAAAHAEGVYHRDLSPDNILVTDGHAHGIRLIDFGVARHEYTSAGTLDGSITGKPPYMSPEQCRGGKVDGRSDLYSLGVVFYTLLAGKPPFVAVNPLEVMKMHESEPVPPLPGDVPKGVAVIVYKMLEKEPDRRYPSAETVRKALELA